MPHTNRKHRKSSSSTRNTLETNPDALPTMYEAEVHPNPARRQSTASHPTPTKPTQPASLAGRNVNEVISRKRGISTTSSSRGTPLKTPPHGAGTSASWSSASNSNNARFERLEKMAGHSGLDNSPFMPKSTIELLKHEKEYTHDLAEEELKTLKKQIVNFEATKSAGIVVGAFMHGKGVEEDGGGIWRDGAEEKVRADWPGLPEYKRYGDIRANSNLGLKRHLPPPRNQFVAYAQVRKLVEGGMNEEVAISFLGKPGKEVQGHLEELQWEDMSVLGEYVRDEERIKKEGRRALAPIFGRRRSYGDAGTRWGGSETEGEREGFNERAVRATGAWGQLFEEIDDGFGRSD